MLKSSCLFALKSSKRVVKPPHTALVEQYNRDLAAWERQAAEKKNPKREKPPEKESVIKRLRELEAETKRNNQPRRNPKQRSYDIER